MFIQTEDTPNPNALKFLLNQVVNDGEPICIERASAQHGGVAHQLFSLNGVSVVFIGKDFVTITRDPDADWTTLKPQIVMILMDHLMTGMSFVSHNVDATKNTDLTETERQIVDIIDSKIRPAVAGDGGDIVYKGFKDGVVFVELRGACKGCPSSVVTLKRGVESLLKQYVPEVEEVVSE